ncbi:MAG TPA: RNA-binding protein [Flavipsychrobacter sp.]|nr:RNA-binding protein [Flavipsychrobacter sp.]
MTIFIGNLSAQTTEKQLEEIFTPFGSVLSIDIPKEKYSRRAKGFAYVLMANAGDGERAIEELNNSSLQNRMIVVKDANPRKGTDLFDWK